MKTRCFAYKRSKCSILEVDICPEGCAFFRTLQELAKSQDDAERRIKSLPSRQQVAIKKTYSAKGWSV